MRHRQSALAIVTNSIGPGVLAADSAYMYGVELAKLSAASLDLLNESLPRNWSGSNPVDIIGDASPVRFRTAVKVCLDDPNVDGVLVIFTPQAGTDHLTTAQLMVGLQRESNKPLFLSWLGDAKVSESRELFSKSKCAHFRAPEFAIEVFRNLASYHQNQQLLLQTQPLEATAGAGRASARAVIATARRAQHPVGRESKAVLAVSTSRSTRQGWPQAGRRCATPPRRYCEDRFAGHLPPDVGGVELNIQRSHAARRYRGIIGTLQARAEAIVSISVLRKHRLPAS
jgi:acetyltransferase